MQPRNTDVAWSAAQLPARPSRPAAPDCTGHCTPPQARRVALPGQASSSRRRPPWRWAMAWAMARPRPLPWPGRRRAARAGSARPRRRGRRRACPEPLSATHSRAWPSCTPACTVTLTAGGVWTSALQQVGGASSSSAPWPRACVGSVPSGSSPGRCLAGAPAATGGG